MPALEFQQRQPPEGINTSTEHPLKEFSWLLLTVFLFIVAAIATLSLAGHWLAGFIPFSVEQRLASSFDNSSGEDDRMPAAEHQLTSYLQNLAERLSVHMDLDEEIRVTLHYIDDETVNAFATLGGHIFFFRGLLKEIPDENTLAMVMAHEIAHVKLRHPVKSLGRAVVVGSAVSLFSAATGGEILDLVLGETGLLTALKFSREQEAHADQEALAAVQALYGHTQGSTALFDILLNAGEADGRPAEFFSSHPYSEKRIDRVTDLAREQNWPRVGQLTPLPSHYRAWLETARDG